jgi:hypothetical protein
LIRKLALLAVAALLVSSACAKNGLSQPTTFSDADLYAAGLSDSQAASLLGSDWWPEPPTFEVQPLDAAMTSPSIRFGVVQTFLHIGTQEGVEISIRAHDKSSSAVTTFTTIENDLGTSSTGPPIGDQRDYYSFQSTTNANAAPYETIAFVRIAAVVLTVRWLRKDRIATPTEISKIANVVVSHVRDLNNGKLKAKPLATEDAALLPPAGQEMTQLGESVLDLRAYATLDTADDLTGTVATLKQQGVTRMIYATYALNADTHMEVRAGLLKFDTTDDAALWQASLVGTNETTNGPITAHFDEATGQTVAVLRAGVYFGMLVCRSTAQGEASSRACDKPLQREGPAWVLALAKTQGLLS